MAASLSIMETGVPGLDFLLGGGIPENDTLLVIGPPGTGKTILCLQTLFHQAHQGRNVLYISTTSESPLRLFRHLRTLSFFDESLVDNQVSFLNLYSLLTDSLDRVPDALLQQIREHQIQVVVLDGIDTIRDLHPETAQMRKFLFQLLTVLAVEQVTSIITTSITTPGEHYLERTMVDGILEFTREDVGNRSIRYASCLKMRAMPIVSGRHTMQIDANGVMIFPRFEVTYVTRDAPLGNERVAFGIPELDALMAGGPFAGGSIVVAGAVGTGKTLLSLRYLLEGARQGEKGLFVGFRESPSDLLRLAQRVGIDLQPALDAGQLVIFHRVPINLLIDEVTENLLSEVTRLRPQRLVIDSVDEIERAVIPGERRWEYLTALAGCLHDEGITTLLTREVSQIIGTELDFAQTPMAELASNLILLRWVEFHGELFRILSILKMRGSAFDSSIRQFEIGPSGIRVLQKVEAAEGLLTGVARRTSNRPYQLGGSRQRAAGS